MSLPQPAAVRVDNVSLDYGRVAVLSEVSLVVPKGEITAVLGPSGCGKTTLLRAIAGLERIASGRIEVDGREVAAPGRHIPPEKRSVGLVPQEGALFSHLTVAGNVGFGLRGAGLGRAGRAARVAELLGQMGLTEFAKRRPAMLSGGQQQRVALARALAPRPEVIGLDEPYSALDAALRTRLREEVAATLRAEEATALLVTHDAEEALSTADSVVVMLDGRVRQHGSPQQLYESPVDAAVARLCGEVSEIPAEARGAVARCVLGEVRLREPLNGAVTLLLRPEDVRVEPGDGLVDSEDGLVMAGDGLVDSGEADGSGQRAVVRATGFTGGMTSLSLDCDGVGIRARISTDRAPKVGERVSLSTARAVHAVVG